MKNLFKKLVTYLLFISFIGITFGVFYSTNWSDLDMLAKRFLFTSDGTASGTSVMDINSGGNVIVYGDLMDGSGNLYITTGGGVGVETDPIWNSESGNYILWTAVSTDISGGNSDTLVMSQKAISGFVYGFNYITSSALSPYLLVANSGDYYTSNPLGFITGSALSPYCLLSGDQTFTGTINIADLYDGAGNRYITGVTIDSVISKFTGAWTSGTGLTISNAFVTSGSVLMGWTITSGSQAGYRGFVMSGGEMLIESTTGENVTFNYVIYK